MALRAALGMARAAQCLAHVSEDEEMMVDAIEYEKRTLEAVSQQLPELRLVKKLV